MPPRSAALTITVYGGVAGSATDGEIGGNKILVEWMSTFLLDFGTRFAVAGRFFEEFLKPRTESACAIICAWGSSLAILKEPPRRSAPHPGGYILCLPFFNITNLVDLDPAGGTHIYSSSEAYDEEQKIDHRRLTDWLSHFRVDRDHQPGADSARSYPEARLVRAALGPQRNPGRIRRSGGDRMSTLFDLLRALLYSAGFVLLWGYLAIQVRPLDQRLGGALPAWTPAAGIAVMVVGGLIAATCIGGFVIWGHGTPAPFDAPRRFVAQGPYRFVRNPMYIGGWAVLAGYGLVQRSPAILWLSLVMIGCAHLFVVLYEEPNLERRFGEDYRAYKRAVRRWLPRFSAILVLWLSVGACGGGPSPSRGPGVATRVTEYRNGQWFDGQRFVPRTMYVSGDRFRERRPRHVDTVIDLAGHWVVPPYADAQQPMIEPAHLAIYAGLFLHDGIFYVRDLGGAPLLRARIDTAVNTATSFDVVSANQGWTAPGGYPIDLVRRGEHLGLYDSTWLKDSLDIGALMLVATADDVARRWPLFMSARPKPDYVKLYLLYSEQYARRQDDPHAAFDRGLDPALVPDIVHRAHAAGLTVSANVYTAADFRNAVAGGVDEIVHVPGGGDLPADAFRLSDLDAEVAAGRRVAVVTALGKLAEQLRRDSAATVERIRDVYAPNVETLRRRGVRLLVGGDLFRQSAAAEIRVLGRLGMFSSLELLRMWSVITPQALFPRRKIGALADGYEASFLVLAGDPLQDFANTQRIERRVKRGRSLDVPAQGPTFP